MSMLVGIMPLCNIPPLKVQPTAPRQRVRILPTFKGSAYLGSVSV